ncbi:hypothetical protein J2755_001447 [Methanohalophilus levihalophilus]|uniref:hypothetical protein n=1 Tax=Methanohalophilus levihalophilus TaxID=1431282 RepID=UPI001AE7432B|nr:hypothetical protein [Methanohalophilus levihalophilus]MBP2030513.1 hypothetical protein [Methanohalophilus levihalophilus]
MMVNTNVPLNEYGANSSRNFNEWRKQWLVNQAKERHIQSVQEMETKKNNGFWDWYVEKNKELQKKYNHLYSDITAKELREHEKGWQGIDQLKSDIDSIRQQFIRHDRETIMTIAESLEKIGMKKEAEEFVSSKPMNSDTIKKLDRLFDALHRNNFNDLQIQEFYQTLSPEEKISLGCRL